MNVMGICIQLDRITQFFSHNLETKPCWAKTNIQIEKLWWFQNTPFFTCKSKTSHNEYKRIYCVGLHTCCSASPSSTLDIQKSRLNESIHCGDGKKQKTHRPKTQNVFRPTVINITVQRCSRSTKRFVVFLSSIFFLPDEIFFVYGFTSTWEIAATKVGHPVLPFFRTPAGLSWGVGRELGKVSHSVAWKRTPPKKSNARGWSRLPPDRPWIWFGHGSGKHREKSQITDIDQFGGHGRGGQISKATAGL